MLKQPTHSNAWQQAIQSIVASRPITWLLARTQRHLDRATLKLSGGRQTFTALLSGLQVVTVTTRGAKTGEPRSVPLIPLPDGDKLVLVASNYGQAHHPGWYYNLRACPEAQVTFKGKTVAYTAREASEVEAELYWKQAGEIYRGYPLYRQRAQERVISIFVLTPLH